MDLRRDTPAIQTLFMAYSLILAGVWAMRVPQASITPFMIFLHIGLAFLLLEWLRFKPDAPRTLHFLAGFLPFLLWAAAWWEIGWLYRLARPEVYDGAVKAIDHALFRVHLNEELSTWVPWVPVRNIMGLSYLSYYLLILGPTLVLAVRKRSRDLEYHTLGLLFTYLVCFVIYLLMPVLGPKESLVAEGAMVTGVGGLFGPLINAFFAAGDSLGTAFPSSHCAASVTAAILVRRHFGPGPGRLATVWAALIVISTIYTNNHYLVDAVAGVATSLVTSKLVELHWNRSTRKSAPAVSRVPGVEWEIPVLGQPAEGRKLS